MVRVLVVDDSALVRELLTRGLSMDPDIEVVGAARDPYVARDLIVKLNPNVLTLDVEMPRMDGLEFLKKLMPQYPLPVVMVSALTERGSQITFDALAAGAIDFVAKPSMNIARGLSEMMAELREKVKMAATIDVSHWKNRRPKIENIKRVKIDSLSKTTDKVIAIGASTGGTEAIREVLSALPGDTPGTVIVQHMPAGFTRMFAERLDSLCEMDVKEAQSGDRVLTGRVLVAPGNYHVKLIRSGGIYQVSCESGELVCGHRPSVEVLFESVARFAGSNAIGIMLTGMGSDGADAMVKMRNNGARTLAQNEETCVVFGMPKEAYRRGGAERLAPLDKIPEIIHEFLGAMS
jgi:two-component system, chemotaxis family, protein-glutamate methylesterase/glutaminase